jgi:hypothetical protein
MPNSNLKSLGIIWPILLAAASVVGSYGLACVFPFSAIAALAAVTMERRSAVLMVVAAWLANQFVGFFILSFPWDAQAVGHGISILAATLAAYILARLVADRVGPSLLAKSLAALPVAFVVYEVLLLGYAQIGGGADNFSADIVIDIARNDAIWFAGLMAVNFGVAKLFGNKLVSVKA